MTHGLTKCCKNLEGTILSFLLWAAASNCLEGLPRKENMTTALFKCDEHSGLIGLESYKKLLGIMKSNGFSDIWIGENFTNMIGNWIFLDNSPLDDPTSYFKATQRPIGCGTVHIGDQYFVYKNCLKSGYNALCQNCNYSKTETACIGSEHFFSPSGPTRNWFHARQLCIRSGGDLSILKKRSDIPDISKLYGKSYWTGTHSLKEQVLLHGNTLANISLTGVKDVPKLVKGDACLIAKQKTTVTWSVVSCSEKHHFKCRGETSATSFSLISGETRATTFSMTSGETSAASFSLINTIVITKVGYLVMSHSLYG